MSGQGLIDRLAGFGDEPAMVRHDAAVSYRWLLEEAARLGRRLDDAGVPSGATVSVEADFGPAAVAALLALLPRNCVVVPLTSSVEAQIPGFLRTAEVGWRLRLEEDGAEARLDATGQEVAHPLLLALGRRGHAGLVLFSSGSTGDAKAALHDFDPILRKFDVRRNRWRALAFLLFDHIGGINTLLYSLSNGGCLVTVAERSPEAVAAAIERHRVELLPTSPTFLTLLLLSETYRRHDLSSLRLVTYGTEVMPESTLQRLGEALPHVTLQQTYGLSELGILRSKSRASDSLWVKLGGEGFETRVVDGLLEVKAESTMLGYLNAASPFTEDGWFRTGDAVDVDGEWLRIRGRVSECINVGGNKVFPAEVESVLLTMDGVEDATVTGEHSAITGNIVTARVKLATEESLTEFRPRMRSHCRGRLEPYKIPQKVTLVDVPMHGERFKKMRRQT